MPQINETLMDFFLMNSFLFILFLDWLTILDEVDDSLLVYNNVLLLIYCAVLPYWPVLLCMYCCFNGESSYHIELILRG